MSKSNYRLQWCINENHKREMYFGTPNQLNKFERGLKKQFNYETVSSMWDGSKWIKYVQIGNKILTLADMQTLIKKLM